MGIYLNPNNDNFTRTTKREIYVDKTMMISVLNGFMEVDNTYVCVSRPRRFGKTIAGNMPTACCPQSSCRSGGDATHRRRCCQLP